MNIFLGLIKEIWYLLEEMAPYLLLGFAVAGVLHVLLPKEKVTRHLSHNRFSAVVKASVFGIPLPLCSCGVIPVAAHLEKQGARRGPILSFLISTPTTGVDSILATYALLGPLLTVMRPLAALFNGLLTGGIANWLARREEHTVSAPAAPEQTAITSGTGRLRAMVDYAFKELVADVAKWLLIGIVAGGIISYLIPDAWIGQYLGNPLLAYPLMLLIGIPMYVCATGSIPIAASLILKGMSPGAGFIFLFAGPATNTATLSFVGGKMGKRHLLLYLGTILISGLLFGGLIDLIWQFSGQDAHLIGGHMEMLPGWLKTGSALLLLGLMLRPLLPARSAALSGDGMLLTVNDINCAHCRLTIDSSLRALDGVREVRIDLPRRQVEVVGDATGEQIIEAIRRAGYDIDNGGGV